MSRILDNTFSTLLYLTTRKYNGRRYCCFRRHEARLHEGQEILSIVIFIGDGRKTVLIQIFSLEGGHERIYQSSALALEGNIRFIVSEIDVRLVCVAADDDVSVAVVQVLAIIFQILRIREGEGNAVDCASGSLPPGIFPGELSCGVHSSVSRAVCELAGDGRKFRVRGQKASKAAVLDIQNDSDSEFGLRRI